MYDNNYGLQMLGDDTENILRNYGRKAAVAPFPVKESSEHHSMPVAATAPVPAKRWSNEQSFYSDVAAQLSDAAYGDGRW